MALSRETQIGLLSRMLLVRRFEERAGQQYGLGKINGFCHLYIGQEAVAVGCLTALDKDDYAISGYREHGHALVRGVPPGAVMAELFGKATGTSRGKGGSMHIMSAEHRFLGGYGIVGGQVPLGLGYAFASKYRGDSTVVQAFLGDAAVNQGVYYESLNMAALWNLPLICIIENNGYGMGTAVARASAVTELYKKSEGLGVHSEWVDGMDVIKVREAAERLVERAREESKPAVLECRTYRFRGHSMADPATYRTKEELEAYRKQDPVLSLRDRLKITEDKWKAMEAEVKAVVDASVKFADESPEPDASELMQYIHPTNDNNAPERA